MPFSISGLLSSFNRYQSLIVLCEVNFVLFNSMLKYVINRLIHANIGRGMIAVLIWKRSCISLFITYFNIELKRTNLTSHTDTKLMDMSDRYRLRVLLPKCQHIFPRWTSTFSKRQLTVGRKWRYEAHERLDIVLSEFCPDGRYRCGTSGVYVWAKLMLLLINMW